MGRIKLNVPSGLPFSYEDRIRINDLNYGNHLGNDRVLSYMHDARARFLKNMGCSELDAFGTGIIVVDVGIIYKNQGFFGDLLTVSVGVSDISSRSFDLLYRLEKEEGELALGKTGIICFDYDRQKVAKMTDRLSKELQKYMAL